jgi:hypothetical protein
MRPRFVVISKPIGGSPSSFEYRQESMHVEELVAYLPVERFNVCILRRFSGRNEVKGDIALRASF